VAINKSNSPMWVKVTLIVLIVAFMASLVTIVANPFQSSSTPPGATPTGASTADSQYQPQVAGLTAQLQSDPASYTVLVSLGNTYFDWAMAKQKESSTSTSSAGADAPLWISAKDAYARALAVNAKESSVRVDHSITVFYTGDTATAIKLAEDVTKDDPTFGPAYFNLGIFYQNTNDKAKALAAYNKYLELDPQGSKGGNPDYAKQQIEALQ